MRHEPLAFLSGSFRANQLGWSTIEKESFAIVYAMERLKHITLTALVYIHTDHRNIKFIFNRDDSKLPKYALDKVTRWALKLGIYNFSVSHTPGILNVWPDLLSRWGAPKVRRILICAPPRYEQKGLAQDISEQALI